MDNFNFKKFLTENKLTKTSILREGIEDNIEQAIKEKKIDLEKVIAAAEKAKKGDSNDLAILMATAGMMKEAKNDKIMSKSELKTKIKEMIIAELSLTEEDYTNIGNEENFLSEGSDDEDYEKSSREVEFGVNPDKEEFDLKDFFMDDDEELAPEIPGFEGTRDTLDDLKIREAKKKKDDAPEEELDLDLGKETPEGEENLDLNLDTTDTAPAEDNFNIDTSAVDPNIKAVQDALTQAQAAAEKIQDEKLTQQIGNTITMFTRTHIANKEPIRENEEYTEGSNNRFFTGDDDGPSLNISEVEDYLESYIFDDWESIQDSPSLGRKYSEQNNIIQKAINKYLESDLSNLTADMTDDQIEDQIDDDLDINSYLEEY